jgi:mannose-6-phosphate isomerase-like protein (cupin superfamily)
MMRLLNHNSNINKALDYDFGSGPPFVDIDQITKDNKNYRIVLWTGNHLQLIVMHLETQEEIGIENHSNLDQYLHIIQGRGVLLTGDDKDKVDVRKRISRDFSIIIPAGTWHNLVNTGIKPLKLYSIYTTPKHPPDTVHVTRAAALADERY